MSTTNCVELVLHNGQTAKEPIPVFDRDEQIQPPPPPASEEEENKIMKDKEINHQGPEQDSTHSSDFITQQIKEMRGMLMIVATLLLQMSYQAGLNPPGGFWQDDPSPTAARSSTMTASSFAPAPLGGENGGDAVVPLPYQAGDPIMRFKNHRRYREFEILNSMSLAYSSVLILILLVLSLVPDSKASRLGLVVAVGIMYLDLLTILAAYNTGAVTPENRIISLIPYIATVVVFVVAYTIVLGVLKTKMQFLFLMNHFFKRA